MLFSVTVFAVSFTVHQWLLYFSKNKQAQAIAQSIREDLITGNRRNVIAALNNSLAFGFDSIIVETYDQRPSINLGEQRSIYGVTVIQSIYFDGQKEYAAANIRFTYVITEGLANLIYIWIVLTAIGAIPLQKFIIHQQKRQNERTEAQNNKAVLEVINGVVHDLRGPVGTFESLLYISPDEVTKLKPQIHESLNRINSMIDSLRSNEIDLLVKPVLSILDLEVGFSFLKAKAIKKHVQLILSEVPNTHVFVDTAKFERAWVNIASNALDFARSEVQIELKVIAKNLILKVTDDGPGVPEEFIPKLFLRGNTHGKPDGTGLGLAYAKQVMMGHGGDIRYYRENNLTVFECFIPNAVHAKSSSLTEKSHIELESKERVRKNVGIAFRPPLLSSEVLEILTNSEVDSFNWHEGFDPSYDFIITNDPNIVDRCIDEGISVAQFKPDTSSSEIVRRTFIRLGIPQDKRAYDV